MIAELAHYGRIVHPDIAEGRQALCSTASTVKGQTRVYDGKKDFMPAREMTKADFEEVIKDYQEAANRAKEAGFDGVEIHGAHGLLIA